MRQFFLSTTAVGLLAGTVHAEDAALILGTDSYEQLGRVARGSDVLNAEDGLTALGFAVTSVRNGRIDGVRDALSQFGSDAAGADRIVVILAGRFVTDGTRSWYLTAESVAPELLTVERSAVSIDSLLSALGDAAGNAILMIGSEPGGTASGPWLSDGIGDLHVPQGVTVLSGSARDVSSFASGVLTQPQEDIVPYIADYGLATTGYAPAAHVIMPMRPSIVPVPKTEAPVDTGAEVALWEGARALDTVDAYRNYIRNYPDGLHTAEAETLIAEILGEPNRAARLAEDALSLSRDARREIQRDLSLLDYNTRGIDGIFGSGTRTAITNWQQENGFSQTSYLTEDQIARLDAQAARRAAELEAEAERRRREAELVDRTFWEETGAKGDEPGLRTYLERYPDGIFSELATERLDKIVEDKRLAAEAEEASAWDRASGADTVGAYQDYLSAFPEGQFVGEAQSRIGELTAQEEIAPELEAAQAAEADLQLNTLTRRLVELRLEQMGLEPGEVDGTFDDTTRRAIRRYQTNSEIEGMGYLNEATLVRLLADAVNALGQ